MNIARCLGVLILSLICYQRSVKDNRRNRFYFYCNLGALVMYVCCSFLPVISRIGYYLTITHIFFLPALIAQMENPRWKKLFTAGAAAAAVLYFALFMRRAGGCGASDSPVRNVYVP